MTAQILSGKEVAAKVREEVAERVAALADRGKSVGLATVLVGDDPASHVYVNSKHKAAQKAGIQPIDHKLPDDTGQDELEALVADLNGSPDVDGILVQLPLPDGLNEFAVVQAIDPAKDADGLHPVNLGNLVMDRATVAPATPGGVLRILDHYEIPTEGAFAVVVGRSFLVGRPLAILLNLKDRNSTVVSAHSRTKGLSDLTRKADILVAAVGRPHMIGGDDIKPGATVIDVGINRTDDGLVGDVNFDEAVEVAGAITPVPGGVGPMTIASLLANTVAAAERSVAD
jgi:methylenetetrahydrofolate dehydrogenase (NADP+)/methenyltetrahydrofolate cyclohydrolase